MSIEIKVSVFAFVDILNVVVVIAVVASMGYLSYLVIHTFGINS